MVYYNIIYIFNTSRLDTVLLCSVHDVLYYMCPSSNDHNNIVNVIVDLADIIINIFFSENFFS